MYVGEVKSVDVVRLKTLMRLRSEVLKFNPNHDEIGRFSEGSGGGTGGGSVLGGSGNSVKGASGREMLVGRVHPDDLDFMRELANKTDNPEADFARRVDLMIDREAKKGINVTPKVHKNESSWGQRLNPSKLHEDDKQDLAETTDPVERMQKIDDLLNSWLYNNGNGESTLRWRPPQKRLWIEESGLISRA